MVYKGQAKIFYQLKITSEMRSGHFLVPIIDNSNILF